MKQPVQRILQILPLCWLLATNFAQAQTDKGGCESCANGVRNTTTTRTELAIYPNPTTDYIALNNEDLIVSFHIINLVGKRVRTFEVQKNETYDVADLPNGLYLVQLIGRNNKVISTQRLTKR